jgi:F-box/leucine-rich repeat protein 14
MPNVVGFENLCQDACHSIFKYLDPKSTKMVCVVSKKLNEFASHYFVCLANQGGSLICMGFDKLRAIDFAVINNLSHINLSCGITDLDLVRIAQLTALGRLTLAVKAYSLDHYTDDGVKEIGNLTNLVELNLSEILFITDNGFKAIVKLTNLTKLNLHSSEFTYEGLKGIGKLGALVELNLPWTKHISGRSFAGIQKLTNLQKIDLAHSWNVTTCALQKISTVSSLLQLNLSQCYITSDALKHIVALTNLTRLDLSSLAISTGDRSIKLQDDHIQGFGVLTNMQQLNLYYGSFTEVGMKEFAGLTKLVKLDLSSNYTITNAAVKHIKKFTNLQGLNLGCWKITDGLKNITTLTKLEKLQLSCCLGINASSLNAMTVFTNLKQLDLKSTTLEDECFIAKLTNLEQLNLSGCEISDEGLKNITALTNLLDLNLANYFNMADAVLIDLAKLTRLTQLDLSYCNNLTSAGLQELATLANLTKLEMRGYTGQFSEQISLPFVL